MAKCGYSIVTPSAVALTAATARTVLFLLAGSTFGIDLSNWEVSFDGVTIGNVPVYVELCYLTGASNVTPGTNNTAVNAQQEYGRAITATAFSAGAACAAGFEPTVQTTLKGGLLTPYGGKFPYDWSLGRTPDSAPSNGFAIRCTAPAAVNVRAEMHLERC